MRPHPDDFHGALIFENLVNETVLYVYPARIRTVQITYQLLERRWVLKRIGSQYLEQPLDLRAKIGRSNFLGVFLRLLRKVEFPTHQLSFFEDLLSASFNPLRIESRIPGMDMR